MVQHLVKKSIKKYFKITKINTMKFKTFKKTNIIFEYTEYTNGTKLTLFGV